jgi:hypothetical protein
LLTTGYLSSIHPVVFGAVMMVTFICSFRNKNDRDVEGCGGGADGGVGVLRALPVAGCVRVSSSVDHL